MRGISMGMRRIWVEMRKLPKISVAMQDGIKVET